MGCIRKRPLRGLLHTLKMAAKEKSKALQYSHSLGFGLRPETIPQDNRQKGNPTAASG